MSFATLLQAVVSGLLLGGIYALVAMSLALVFGVMRVLNFAHGALLMAGMYGIVVLNQAFGINPYAAIVLVAPVLALIGIAVYFVLIRRVLGAGPLMQAQVTLGLSFAIQSTALLVFGADLLNVRTSLDGAAFRVAGVVIGTPELIGFLISIVVCAALTWFILSTEFGRRLRAVAQDPTMAILCGIPVRSVQMMVFVGCTALLAVPAGCLMAFSQLTPTAGIQYSLLSLMVVVLGGLGDLRGAFVGGLLIGIVEAVTSALFNNPAAPGIIYLVFGLALLARPRGLFGRGSEA